MDDMKSGNRCGHDLANPRFFEREGADTYDVIHTCIANLREYYFDADSYLPNLQASRTSKKQMRTERREAIAALAQVLVSHVSLVDLKIVQWTRGNGKAISIESLADEANLILKRTKRVLHDLKDAGYYHSQRKCKTQKNNKVVPLLAEKYLSPLFFLHLGIDVERLEHCILTAKNKHEHATRPVDPHTLETGFPTTAKEIIKLLRMREKLKTRIAK